MKTKNYQPEKMNTVNAYLMVKSVDRLVSLAKTVFGGRVENYLKRPDGAVMHCEISIGDSIIMAGEPSEEFGIFPCSLFVYVENCDEIYQKAVDAGCESIMVPATMKHAGERYGGVKDDNGNIWWIGTHLEDLTPEEQAARISEQK